jgi:predicted XRE-type DNA-binding protein
MAKSNPHTGSSFDDFLKEDGIYEEVTAKALKRALTEQIRDAMTERSINKVTMAQRMETSRSQVDRLLDPDNLKVQFDSLIRAAAAIGKSVEIRLVDDKAAA